MTAVPDPLDRVAPWSRPGCSYPGCKTQATVTLDGIAGRRCAAHPPTLDRLEQVDPLAAFRLARAWFAWHADERFLAAAERVAS
jgi:hypothetical protein